MVRLQLDPDDTALLVRTPMVLEEDMTSIVGKVFQDNSMFEISDAYSDSRFDPRSKTPAIAAALGMAQAAVTADATRICICAAPFLQHVMIVGGS